MPTRSRFTGRWKGAERCRRTQNAAKTAIVLQQICGRVGDATVKVRMLDIPGGAVAAIHSEEPIVTDERSALDFATSAGAQMIIVNKSAIAEDFFKLPTGIAGEIVQKLVTYGFRLAIVGDFSQYTSEALRAYIRESNRGTHLYFASDEADALRRLGD